MPRMILQIIALFLISSSVLSAVECKIPSEDEVAILYINGIDTDGGAFKKNVKNLKDGILKNYKNFSLDTSVHNPTWGMVLDVHQALAQLEQDMIRSNPNGMSIADNRVYHVKLAAAKLMLEGEQLKSREDFEEIERYLSNIDDANAIYDIRDAQSTIEMLKNSSDQELANLDPVDILQMALTTEAYQSIINQYIYATKEMYKASFESNLPEIAPALFAQVEHLLQNNEPFIVLGHSQGTIIGKQLVQILDDFIDEIAPKQIGESEMYGLMELASMNLDIESNWSSSSRAKQTTLFSDIVQRVVASTIYSQTNGRYSLHSPTNGFHFEYFNFDDSYGHGLASYAKDYPSLNNINVGKIERIRKSLRVCEEKPVKFTCPEINIRYGSNYNQTVKTGHGSGTLFLEFDAFTIPDYINVYVNDELVRRSFNHAGKLNWRIPIRRVSADQPENTIRFEVEKGEGTSEWSLKTWCN
ncbi:hypothetical protein [Oceanobacter antarcticus]|uniref:DUF2974 domain-containing protein n=1 Tax=Oceanobacter antarcticus TaxID=3133425 RepID=A0ABW8NGR7_9GAMM